MGVTINPPPSMSGNAGTNFSAIYSYLLQLAESLNVALQQIDSADAADSDYDPSKIPVSKSLSSSSTDKSSGYAVLKSMIIKNATYANSELTRIGNILRRDYVANSEFGNFTESLQTSLEDGIEGLVFKSGYEAQIEAFSNYIVNSSGYLKFGIIGYSDTTPILGIAIGQNVTINEDGEVESSDFYSTYTANKLTFMHGTEEVFTLVDGSITAKNLNILGGTVEIGDLDSELRSVVVLKDCVDDSSVTKYGLEAQWRNTGSNLFKSNIFANELNFYCDGTRYIRLWVLPGYGVIGVGGYVGPTYVSSSLVPWALTIGGKSLEANHISSIINTYALSGSASNDTGSFAWYKIFSFTVFAKIKMQQKGVKSAAPRWA